MANKTITDFTPVTNAAAGDEYEVMQSGVTLKTTNTKIAAFLASLTQTLSNKTMVAPVLGAATATSINKVALTAPATGATITIADGKTAAFTSSITVAGTDGKTVTVNNNLTFAGTDGTTITFQGTDTYVGRATTDTLTNKRITLRVATLTDAATVTPDVDSYDGGKLTTLSQNTTIANPTGTPTAFQRYILRIKSSAARTLSFGAQFRGSADMALPTATSGSSLTDYLVFQWNADDSKWDLLGRNFGF